MDCGLCLSFNVCQWTTSLDDDDDDDDDDDNNDDVSYNWLSASCCLVELDDICSRFVLPETGLDSVFRIRTGSFDRTR